MSNTITFDAVFENDNIQIPVNYRDELSALFQGKKVRITVESAEKPKQQTRAQEIDLIQDAEEKGYDSFIDYLLDHPVRLPDDVTYLTREEANAR